MSIKLICLICFTPPGLNLILALGGLLCQAFSTRLSRIFYTLSILLLYIFSTELFSSGLASFIEISKPLVSLGKADAICVLGGGNRLAPEFPSGLAPNVYALQRLQLAAFLNESTELPIITSGGLTQGDKMSESAVFAEILKKRYRIDKVIEENKSQNTWENAKYTAEITRAHGFKRILLVTNAWHMRRAKFAFEKFGLEVIPAPTGSFANVRTTPLYKLFLPSAFALFKSQILLLESMGNIGYRFKTI